jgi:uncharacterized protein (UPF0264 family)
MLASVRTLEEASVALRLGADLIDLKEPSRGALGALDHAAVRVMVHMIAGRRPVSATIGDQPEMEPSPMAAAAEQMAATGVNFIKVGLFLHPRVTACIEALSNIARGVHLIAVLLADQPWRLTHGGGAGVLEVRRVLQAVADSGFAGAMLDTGRKDRGSLRAWRSEAELAYFIRQAKTLGLLCGLAGSLQETDIALLLDLQPDYLGFRGALCGNGARTATLDAGAFSRIRTAISAAPRATGLQRGSIHDVIADEQPL